MKEKLIMGYYLTHKVVKTDTPCEHCHGTLYRYFYTGEISCVKCLNKYQGQKKQGQTPKDLV